MDVVLCWCFDCLDLELADWTESERKPRKGDRVSCPRCGARSLFFPIEESVWGSSYGQKLRQQLNGSNGANRTA